MSKKAILITHQYILENESWKFDAFDFCVKHYRNNNPDAYIVLTGHGKLPNQTTLDAVDWHYWPSDIIDGEKGKGHPILVSIGLQHLKEKGIEYVCKTRTDSVNMMEHIVEYCHDKLKSSNKQILNTFYYKDKYCLMDLFMYCDVDTMMKMFNPRKWNVPWINDGTGPLAKNYIEDINGRNLPSTFDKDFWKSNVEENIVIASPDELKWMNFREVNDPNGHRLTPQIKSKLMSNSIENVEYYTWKHY